MKRVLTFFSYLISLVLGIGLAHVLDHGEIDGIRIVGSLVSLIVIVTTLSTVRMHYPITYLCFHIPFLVLGAYAAFLPTMVPAYQNLVIHIPNGMMQLNDQKLFAGFVNLAFAITNSIHSTLKWK